MSWPQSFFFPDRVLIAAYRGSGGAGEVFADPVEKPAEVIDRAELVRSADGDEVVSSTRVTVPIDVDAPVGSLVTVWPGEGAGVERTALVLQVSRERNPAPLPSHLVLHLK